MEYRRSISKSFLFACFDCVFWSGIANLLQIKIHKPSENNHNTIISLIIKEAQSTRTKSWLPSLFAQIQSLLGDKASHRIRFEKHDPTNRFMVILLYNSSSVRIINNLCEGYRKKYEGKKEYSINIPSLFMKTIPPRDLVFWNGSFF